MTRHTWRPARPPKAPSLKALAKQIMTDFPDLVAIVYPAGHPLGGYCDTDRHPKGVRWRIPGKGRRGSRLVVLFRIRTGNPGQVVFEHNAAQTYRTNRDVVAWIEDERRRRGTK